MRVLISVEHPAWAHQFKFIIKELDRRGHEVGVLVVNKDGDKELLDIFNIKYTLVAGNSGTNRVTKGLLLITTTWKTFVYCLKFKPDIFIGRASPMMAINSYLFSKKHYVFEDTERSWEALSFCKLLSSKIFTPLSFSKNLGYKHERVDTYKELFYLHPDYFTPDPTVLTELGLKEGEVFTMVRFVSWKASHDLGHLGLTSEEKLHLVNVLKTYGKVFISSEEKLPNELLQYRYTLPLHKIHDLLYYATLLYTEGRTMASEAAVLGTHAVYYNLATEGYTSEQELKYGLVFNFQLGKNSLEKSFSRCSELLNNPDLWRIGKEKRKVLLDNKVDVNNYFLNLIEKN